MDRTEPLASNKQLARINKAGLLLFAALLGAVGCTRPQTSAKSQQPAPAMASKDDNVFICPAGDIQKTGSNDHKVTLTWNPSTAYSPSKVRYCLYRTEEHQVEKSDERLSIDKRPCKNCARVNDTAVAETHYIDTQVRNGARYCYVAVAMQIRSDAFSGFSNQVEADIPQDPKSVPSQVSLGKLCNCELSAKSLNKQRRR